ncbi:GLUCAN ENDO-13-BETA-GLUCOSIDASE A6-RELATED [Salix purpurea]|uniref:glucan endo-1,3-beta-D-glucosidase n=1 Tax=Salix purpurea TaxID=77065 RepID=A0A9Q0PF45_SALPP|nr:GLUCAN ENDO-13-BETA-GLUCOSIDASE A6-RELATED [Salix purpurea]
MGPGSAIHVFIFALLISISGKFAGAEISSEVGINYGRLGNDLPSPSKSVELIKSLKAKRVKIYDANPDILKSLRNTDIQVSIMVPNALIPNMSTSQHFSDQWVETNVVPYYPDVKIRYLLVGNEILTNPDTGTWFNLVPAMRRIKISLTRRNIRKIKVGTPSAINVLESSSPPSNGTFRSDVSGPVIKPMLQFLNRTKSFFFIDFYPFFAWSENAPNISLDYALSNAQNVFGFFIAETGWPNGGDFEQFGANTYNSATYNRNVVRKLTTIPAIGTPARPGVAIPAFIFSLYNENQKPGPGTERHFGLYYPNGTEVFEIDLSGKTPLSGYKKPLPLPTNNEPYKGKLWCVVAKEANRSAVKDALAWACSQGNKTCDEIQPGKECYKPVSLFRHASYAFSSYWAEFKKIGGVCSFNGLATTTFKDPSFGQCKLPSVTL